eukprot:969815-Prorocentrum_minimum.AAC.1
MAAWRGKPSCVEPSLALCVCVCVCVCPQVVSSLEEVMTVPGMMDVRNPSLEAGKNPIYNWLHAVNDGVWTDPLCGNGVCETPYEFPAYET